MIFYQEFRLRLPWHRFRNAFHTKKLFFIPIIQYAILVLGS
jgi:hypothetical protein